MAYKKLIKVSNVCQLLDKRKYPATRTIDGVTFTNNGDGTITVNGTCTNPYYSGIYLNIEIDKMNPGHIYFNIARGFLLLEYSGGYLMKSNNTIFKLPEHEYIQTRIVIRVNSGVTVSDMILKPQLFDLTEMYGAGNEPTTVEQFRQDFPEEMYDYSPHCWLTSYKRVFMTGGGNYLTSYQRNLTCKTKNLFDINSAKKFNGNSSFSINGNQITVSRSIAETYRSANVLLDTSLVGKTISLTALAMTSGINNTNIRIQWLANNGLASGSNIHTNTITGNSFQKLTLTGVVPEKPSGDFNNLCIMFYSNVDALLETGVVHSATFTNIQIELGDTATDYVPYGHL